MRYLLAIVLLSTLIACIPPSSAVLEKICLENHLYWSNSDTDNNNFAFAPILDDDGKPIKCKGK